MVKSIKRKGHAQNSSILVLISVEVRSSCKKEKVQWRRKRFTPSHFPSSKDVVSHFRSTFNVIKNSLIPKEDYIHLKIILIFKLLWDFRPCVLPFVSAALIARIDSWNTAKNMLNTGFLWPVFFRILGYFMRWNFYSYDGQSLSQEDTKRRFFFLFTDGYKKLS